MLNENILASQYFKLAARNSYRDNALKQKTKEYLEKIRET